MAAPALPQSVWAVVPVKRFDRAKQRLARVLGGAERAALAAAMLGDVLEQIAATSGFAGTLVVSGDPEAATIGQAFGATAVADPLDAGTNAAVGHGIRACAASDASGVMVIPGDIPFVTRAELTRVLAALRQAPVVLVPALRDGGTNLLGLSPPGVIAPAFGAGSFARHRTAARDFQPIVLPLDGAGHDIDTPDDLAIAPNVAQSGSGRRTLACLERFGRPLLRLPTQRLERATPP